MRSNSSFTAGVAVEGTVYHFDKIFDYAVRPEDVENIQPGCRVSVPFARGNGTRQGIVLYLKEQDNT